MSYYYNNTTYFRQVEYPYDKTASIASLACPVPPMLEHVLGYSGHMRFVAFYWEPLGDELAWTDGPSSLIGASSGGWQAFTQHPLVRSYLQNYNFGSSDSEATHWLLLDRELRNFTVATVPTVQHFLTQQQPASEPIFVPEVTATLDLTLPFTLDDFAFEEVVVDRAAVRAAIEASDTSIQSMQAWLDAQMSELPYRGFMIKPKQDFGRFPHSIGGQVVAHGFVVTKQGANVMPAAAWFSTITQAQEAIDLLIEADGDADLFWELIRRRTKDTETTEVINIARPIIEAVLRSLLTTKIVLLSDSHLDWLMGTANIQIQDSIVYANDVEVGLYHGQTFAPGWSGIMMIAATWPRETMQILDASQR
jgi:hypothetical protein